MECKPRCHGLGFQEKQYNVVIGPKPPFDEDISELDICCWTSCISSSLILLILLPVLNSYGSQPPRTELEALTIHNFNLTRNDTSVLTPWLATGNFTVDFQARNPSSVVGFRHMYLFTLVSAFYQDTLVGQSEVPQFTLADKSASKVSANVVFREQRLNQSVVLAMQSENDPGVALRITVDVYVKVKRLVWQHPNWFNLTCWVDASLVVADSCGYNSYEVCGLHYLYSKNCTS